MSEKRKAKKKLKAERARVRGEIGGIRRDLDSAWSAFNNITDPNLMDAYIYEISALQSRYNCAVKDLKALYSQEVTTDG
jgi:predicted  nucleic acid-binding Zn-ribbon protein